MPEDARRKLAGVLEHLRNELSSPALA
jgi:hypothetical protein